MGPLIADEIFSRVEELRKQIPKAYAALETALLAEFHELRPQLSRPPDERGISVERWLLWQARKQCVEFLASVDADAPIHNEATKGKEAFYEKRNEGRLQVDY